MDEVTEKGKELQELHDKVSDYVTKNGDVKTEETESVKEKLKLVQEEYTIILRAVSFRLHFLNALVMYHYQIC